MAYAICQSSCTFPCSQSCESSCFPRRISSTVYYIEKQVSYDDLTMQFLLYLIFFADPVVSEIPSVPNPFWIIILLLLELISEVVFSFAKASYFALFLHKVEKRFFTALSVLYKRA